MTDKDKIKPYRLPASPFRSPAKPIGAVAAHLLSDALGQRGFAGPEIVAQWSAIVGSDLARVSAPDRIAWPRMEPQDPSDPARGGQGATLHIRVDGPAAIEVQHMADQIIDRVNQFFGFIAVSKLRIVQAPVAAPAPHRKARPAIPPQAPATPSDPQAPPLSAALGRLKAAMNRGRKA